MSEAMTVPSPEDDLLGEAPEPTSPTPWRLVAWALLAVTLVVLVMAFLAWAFVSERRAELVASTQERLTLTAEGRAEVLATWLNGMVDRSFRVSKSELFRLFATEIENAGGDLSSAVTSSDLPLGDDEDPLSEPLLEQVPLIERVLTDFTVNSGFEAAYLVGLNGVPYAATAAAPALSEAQRHLAANSAEGRRPAYGRLEAQGAGLMLDIAVPIISSQADPETGAPVGALVLVLPVGSGLAEALRPPPLSQKGEAQVLIEISESGANVLLAGATAPSGPVTLEGMQAGAKGLSFAKRAGLVVGAQAFSVAVPVPGLPWWFFRERSVAESLQPLNSVIAVAIVLAVLLSAVFAGLFTTLWWRLANHHNKVLAGQYKDLAGRIDAQKRFLDSITGTVEEMIGLKTSHGVYRYVNKAFADATGQDVKAARGLDDFTFFGAASAERLRLGDQKALDTGTPQTVTEEVVLRGEKRLLQIAKVPYELGEPGGGLLTVARDITALREAERRRELAVQQMVNALVRAVELRDPYLAGHSRRVASLAVAVANRLDLSEADTTTVEIAALLSQVGKLKVPRAILTKPERLAGAELKEMERHIEYALDFLKDLDFGLPVHETVAQMHERLDGKGYPRGFAGDEIGMPARILGVCDVFCARIEPRSYRPVIASNAALEILAEHPHRYDASVVEALRDAVASIEGERLLAGVPGAA